MVVRISAGQLEAAMLVSPNVPEWQGIVGNLGGSFQPLLKGRGHGKILLGAVCCAWDGIGLGMLPVQKSSIISLGGWAQSTARGYFPALELGYMTGPDHHGQFSGVVGIVAHNILRTLCWLPLPLKVLQMADLVSCVQNQSSCPVIPYHNESKRNGVGETRAVPSLSAVQQFSGL